MDDEEFKAEVLAQLERLREGLASVQKGQRRADGQLAAIVSRLDEQDNTFDQVFHEIRMTQNELGSTRQAVVELSGTNRQALDNLRMLTKRVIDLEHPKENDD